MRRPALLLTSILLLSGCFAWFDFGVEWRDGQFALTWVDTHGTMSLSYQADRGRNYWTIVGPIVFSVGSNESYIVAKQHPEGNNSVTNYFIVDKAAYVRLDRARDVIGPLTETEFAAKRVALKLPDFTKTLDHLR